jgi:hypothetical protein
MAVCLAAVVVGLFCGGVEAAPIELFLDPSFGSTEHTGATGSLILTFTEDDNDDWLHIEIANTTPPQIGAKLTAAGLELPDFIETPLSFADDGDGDYFDELTFDVGVSPGWLDASGGYDLMITSDGNFEGGNPHGAPVSGTSHMVVVSLGDTGRTPAELENVFRGFFLQPAGHIAVGRFQSVGPGGQASDKIVAGIPEPSTLALMSCAAIVLLGRARRRAGATSYQP